MRHTFASATLVLSLTALLPAALAELTQQCTACHAGYRLR